MTQIWNKQQCLTVCAANGLKKEQLASTDGEESQSGIKKKQKKQSSAQISAPLHLRREVMNTVLTDTTQSIQTLSLFSLDVGGI